MPRYTLFYLDWNDATVASEDVEASDDAIALRFAGERKGEHADVEVMCGSRILGRPSLDKA